MPTSRVATKTVVKSTGPSAASSSGGMRQMPPDNYVQQGHTIRTVTETERTTTRNRRGNQVVKTKTRTVYYIDGKPVKLNWFDRLRIKLMSTYEKQAFLAEKLLQQERRATTLVGMIILEYASEKIQ